MDAPYCKICDHNHYGVEHVWGKEGTDKTSTDHGGAGPMVPPRSKTGDKPNKPAFDRTAYQREYMRKDRARKKANK